MLLLLIAGYLESQEKIALAQIKNASNEETILVRNGWTLIDKEDGCKLYFRVLKYDSVYWLICDHQKTSNLLAKKIKK